MTHILVFNFPINGFEIFYYYYYFFFFLQQTSLGIFVVEIRKPTVVPVGAKISFNCVFSFDPLLVN